MPLLPDGQTTLLSLSGIGVPPWSARGLRQTLEPIEAATVIRRTINGIAKDLSRPQFRLYRSVITGEDVDPPSCDGTWPGQIITVDCIARLSYLTSGGSPARTIVPGSSYVEGDYTLYRPRLTMIVVSLRPADEDEYAASNAWEMQLEEEGGS